MVEKLDVLVLASHPDDAELSCAGTILSLVAQGKKVGIVDFTKGELGSRGTPELRLQEAEKAGKVLGLTIRENMGFRDGFFCNDEVHQKVLIQKIRFYQPEIVIANAITDRHVDHGKGAILSRDACFLSGLVKIETYIDNQKQDPWRPSAVYHFIQNNYIKPDFIVDITEYWQGKVDAIKSFSSQFFVKENPSDGPETFISSPEFLDFIEARAREFGHQINKTFGEGFTINRPIGVKSMFDLI